MSLISDKTTRLADQFTTQRNDNNQFKKDLGLPKSWCNDNPEVIMPTIPIKRFWSKREIARQNKQMQQWKLDYINFYGHNPFYI